MFVHIVNGVVVHDPTTFALAMKKELDAARAKFPDPDGLMTALTEEVGELARALLEEPWRNVVAEAVQVASTAMRIALEGDPTIMETRRKRLSKRTADGEIPAITGAAGFGPRCPHLGCENLRGRPPCALCYE